MFNGHPEITIKIEAHVAFDCKVQSSIYCLGGSAARCAVRLCLTASTLPEWLRLRLSFRGVAPTFVARRSEGHSPSPHRGGRAAVKGNMSQPIFFLVTCHLSLVTLSMVWRSCSGVKG